MIRESIKMSWKNIIHNKMRSFLTILGIVIGVTSIIALVTIVEGVTGEITNQFTSLGANKITVQAYGTPLKGGLSENDLEEFLKIESVSGISPTLSINTSVVRKSLLEEDVVVEGKNQVYFQNNPELVLRGRPLNILDVNSRSKVVTINQSLEKLLFFGENSIGETVQINGITYMIVGILDDNAGSDMVTMMGSQSGGSEGKAIIPYKTAMSMAGVSKITSMELIIDDSDETDNVIASAELVLNQIFNYNEDSYNIINMESLIESMDTMTSLLTAMMAGIASISLLVGGIGIMNMMLVSVTERTNEIGLRKALGAEPKSIQLQFLIESIFLSFLGGLIGLILGLVISWLVTTAMGLLFAISTWAIVLGVGFSVTIGVVFGWTPARKASMLNPIDALRSA